MTNVNETNSANTHSGVVVMRSRRRFRLPYLIAIVTGSCILTCAGCCILAAIFLQAERFEGPAGANDVASRITDWQMPPGFTGEFGAVADNAILRFDIAKFGHDKGRGIMVIAQTKWKMGNNRQSREMTEDLVGRLIPEFRKIDEKDCETRAATIRKTSAVFRICKGEDLASTTKLLQIKGQFLGKTADVALILQIEDGQVTDKEIDEFIESIH